MDVMKTGDNAKCKGCGGDTGIVPALDLVGKRLACAACGHSLNLEYETGEDGSVQFWLELWTDEDERNKPHPDDGFLNYMPADSCDIVWSKGGK